MRKSNPPQSPFMPQRVLIRGEVLKASLVKGRLEGLGLESSGGVGEEQVGNQSK